MALARRWKARWAGSGPWGRSHGVRIPSNNGRSRCGPRLHLPRSPARGPAQKFPHLSWQLLEVEVGPKSRGRKEQRARWFCFFVVGSQDGTCNLFLRPSPTWKPDDNIHPERQRSASRLVLNQWFLPRPWPRHSWIWDNCFFFSSRGSLALDRLPLPNPTPGEPFETHDLLPTACRLRGGPGSHSPNTSREDQYHAGI